jgi:DNA-binding NarL/FixJ family response regulator
VQKVLIAEDHPLFRDAIREVVGRLFAARGWGLTCLEACATTELFDAVARDDDLDLILLDLFMPGSNGLADLVALRDKVPATPIVVISSLEDLSVVKRALACGAAGYIAKSTSKDAMMQALQVVLDGGIYAPFQDIEPGPAASATATEEPLTPRQIAVLVLLAKGRSNKQIARDLDISDVTVKAHMTAILRKLGVATRAQAIVAFQRSGAMPPEFQANDHSSAGGLTR